MAFRLKEFLLYLVSHKKQRYNMIKKALYPVFLLLCFIYLPLAQAEEKITLSTYYPAPAGEYDKLAAKRMVVGATYPFPDENNLTVEGNVGIGTTGRGCKLTVNGTAWRTLGARSGSDLRWKENIETALFTAKRSCCELLQRNSACHLSYYMLHLLLIFLMTKTGGTF
jgi:hypothetical protein